MFKTKLYLIVCFLCLVRPSQAQFIFEDNKSSGTTLPYTSSDFHTDPGDFQFVIVSDNTGGARPGIFAKAMEKINLLQPDFVINVGDLIEGGETDPLKISRQWDAIDQSISKLKMPFFFIPGNHDVSYLDDSLEKEWLRRRGRLYYHFTYNDALFIMLNSSDVRGESIGKEQYDYAKTVLEKNPAPRWTFVFLHHPLWLNEFQDDGFRNVEKLLSGRKYTVFCGHYHLYENQYRNGAEYYNLSLTGGTSLVRGPKFGEFDHVALVNFKQGNPYITNLALDGILPPDIVTPDTVKLKEALFEACDFKTLVMYDSAFVRLVATSKEALLKKASIELTIRNTTDRNMNYNFTLVHHPQLNASWSKKKGVVAPRSLATIRLCLVMNRPLSVDSLQAVELSYVVGYPDIIGEKPFAINNSLQFVLNRYLYPRRPAIEFESPDVFITEKKVTCNPIVYKDKQLLYQQPGKQFVLYKTPFTINQTEKIKFILNADGMSSGIYEKLFEKLPMLPAVKPGKKQSKGLAHYMYKGQFLKIPDYTTIHPFLQKPVSKFTFYPDEWSYAALYKGYVSIPDDGLYSFYLTSSDGSRLLVDLKTVVDNDGFHVPLTKQGEIALRKGLHRIEIQFYSGWVGNNFLSIEIESKKLKRQKIPFEWFSHDKF